MNNKSILIIGKIDDSIYSSILKMINNKNSIVLIDDIRNKYWNKFSTLDKFRNFSFCPISEEKIESWLVSDYFSLNFLGDIHFDEVVWFGEGHPKIFNQLIPFCEKNKINIIYA